MHSDVGFLRYCITGPAIVAVHPFFFLFCLHLACTVCRMGSPGGQRFAGMGTEEKSPLDRRRRHVMGGV